MKQSILVVACLLVGTLAVQAQSTAPTAGRFLPGSPMSGRRVFVAKDCHRCHAVWGVGGTLGPDLATLQRGRTFSRIAGQLWSHTPQMIILMNERGIDRPVFEPREMRDLISYLGYLSYFDQPGNAARGRGLYRSKGCADCHSLGSVKADQKSPLDRFAGCFSPSLLARDMWNAAPKMREAMAGSKIPQPLLDGRDLADLLAWINVRGRPDPAGRRSFLRPGDPVRGAAVFKARSCTTCHAMGGLPALKEDVHAPELSRPEFRFSVSQVAGRMWNHAFQMMDAMKEAGVPYTPFQGTEMADLVAFLYFAPYDDFPGKVGAGRKLFVSKGCAQCHGTDGVEWSGARPRQGTASPPDPVAILTAFWNHAPLMEQSMRSEELPWPHFSGDQMRDLLTYLASTLGDFKKATPRKGG